MKIDLQKCVVCEKPIPWEEQPNAVYHTWLRVRSCMSDKCRKVVSDSEKDFSKSKRGKFLPKKQVIANIMKNRPSV